MFVFASCQKEITAEATDGTPGGPDTTSNNSGSRVKTYTEDLTTPSGHYVETYNLSYDAEGRLKAMVAASNPGDKFVYQYEANKYMLDIYSSNVFSAHQDFYLNSFQKIDSTLQYNDTDDTSSQKFTYNSARQITQVKEYEEVNSVITLVNTINLEYDSDGNLIKETEDQKQTTYTYTTFANTLNTGEVYNSGSKLLPKTTVITGTGAGTIQHTYTFDSQNRLTSEKQVVGIADGVLIKTYTY